MNLFHELVWLYFAIVCKVRFEYVLKIYWICDVNITSEQDVHPVGRVYVQGTA